MIWVISSGPASRLTGGTFQIKVSRFGFSRILYVTVRVDLPLLDNVISVKSWKRNPCRVREQVDKAQLEVGIWQLP